MSARPGSTVTLLGLLGLVCACHTSPESLATSTASSALSAPDGAILSAVAPQGTQDFEKTQDVHGVLELRTVDWGAASRHPRVEASGASALADSLSDAPVPALVPDVPALLSGAVVTSGEHWYAVSMQDAEHSVYIQGARTSLVLDQVQLSPQGDEVAQAPFTLSRTHRIVTVSFERFGVGYGIDIECARPQEDARCNSESYARDLMGRLGVVGLPTHTGGIQ